MYLPFVRIRKALFNLSEIKSITRVSIDEPGLTLAVVFKGGQDEFVSGDDACLLATDIARFTGQDLHQIGKAPLPPATDPLPDWANYRATGISYDEDPGAVKPLAGSPFAQPNSTPAVASEALDARLEKTDGIDPRIVPGCTVSVTHNGNGFYLSNNETAVSPAKVGDFFVVEKVERLSRLDPEYEKFAYVFASHGGVTRSNWVKFITPPPSDGIEREAVRYTIEPSDHGTYGYPAGIGWGR